MQQHLKEGEVKLHYFLKGSFPGLVVIQSFRCEIKSQELSADLLGLAHTFVWIRVKGQKKQFKNSKHRIKRWEPKRDTSSPSGESSLPQPIVRAMPLAPLRGS